MFQIIRLKRNTNLYNQLQVATPTTNNYYNSQQQPYYHTINQHGGVGGYFYNNNNYQPYNTQIVPYHHLPKQQHHHHHQQQQQQLLQIKYGKSEDSTGDDTSGSGGTSKSSNNNHHATYNSKNYATNTHDYYANKLATRRNKVNRELLYGLQPGDIVEYSQHEDVWHELDRNWAVYVGKETLIRYDGPSRRIVSEPYWSIANKNFLARNIELDRHYYALSAAVTLNRVFYALQQSEQAGRHFSSDKNFVMWARYDINKSDIEFPTSVHKCSPDAIKYMLIARYLNSITDPSSVKSDDTDTDN